MSRCIDVGAGGNGSSGRHVVKHVLEPLVAQVAEAKAPVVVTLGQKRRVSWRAGREWTR